MPVPSYSCGEGKLCCKKGTHSQSYITNQPELLLTGIQIKAVLALQGAAVWARRSWNSRERPVPSITQTRYMETSWCHVFPQKLQNQPSLIARASPGDKAPDVLLKSVSFRNVMYELNCCSHPLRALPHPMSCDTASPFLEDSFQS